MIFNCRGQERERRTWVIWINNNPNVRKKVDISIQEVQLTSVKIKLKRTMLEPFIRKLSNSKRKWNLGDVLKQLNPFRGVFTLGENWLVLAKKKNLAINKQCRCLTGKVQKGQGNKNNKALQTKSNVFSIHVFQKWEIRVFREN